jgi:hypothetical protein
MNSSSPDGRRDLIAAVIETLGQGEALLRHVSDAVYIRRLPAAHNAAIGGHYRHCLDHFRSLLEAAAAGDLDYDQRARGTLIEHNRHAALQATRVLRDGYRNLAERWLDRELSVTCKTRYATAGSQAASSTVGREIMYVVAHAVHHYALIGIMCGMQGVTLPAGFGVAPSTLKHQADLAAVSA